MKKWKTMCQALAVLLAAVLLCGCSIETRPDSKGIKHKGESEYYLYEVNETETDLIETEYTPTDTSTEGMIQELEQMIGGVGDFKDEKLNLLPDGVTILNHELSQNTLTLNVDEDYQDMGIIREILVRAALVRTFIQVPEVAAIQIKVAGLPLTDSKGQEIGPMNTDTFTENLSQNLHSYQFVKLTLYFSNKDGTALIPEKRNIYYMSNLPLERVVLEQLVKGPTQKDCYATLSQDLNILSVVNSDGVCYINFDENFISDALTVHPEITIYSIVNSVIEVCNVERVQISIGGDSNQIFRDMMDLNQFYEKNEKLIQQEEAEETEKK